MRKSRFDRYFLDLSRTRERILRMYARARKRGDVPPFSNYFENYRPRVTVRDNETGVGAPRNTPLARGDSGLPQS